MVPRPSPTGCLHFFSHLVRWHQERWRVRTGVSIEQLQHSNCTFLSLRDEHVKRTLRKLSRASVLLIGDSSDRVMWNHLVQLTLNYRPVSVLPLTPPPRKPTVDETQRNYSSGLLQQIQYRTKISGEVLHVRDGKGLVVEDWSLTAAYFVNLGLSKPLWKFAPAYTRAVDLGTSSIARLAVLNRSWWALQRSAPTVVSVQSYAWDYSSWWMMRGEPRTPASEWFEMRHVQAWASRLPAYLESIRRAFPSSLLLWRTAVLPSSQLQAGVFLRTTLEGIAAMNEAARRIAPKHGFLVLDFALAFSGLSGSTDGIHPCQHKNCTFVDLRQTIAMWEAILTYAHTQL